MTVVVYHKGVIAADRSMTSDGKHHFEACKIVRGKKTLGAAAGSVIAAKGFREWVEHDFQIEYRSTGDELVGLAFDADGVYMVSDGHVISVPNDCALFTGSGSEVAMGAIDMGATAAQAALVAARRLGCAQYGIDVASLDTPINRIFAPKGRLNVNTF